MLDFIKNLLQIGEFKIAAYIISGVISSIPFLLIPDRLVVRIGKTPYLTPNWLSIWRTPLAWIAYIIYFLGLHFVGYLIVVEAFMLDRFDGRVAEKRDIENKKDPNHEPPTGKFWEDLNYPGSTPTGKWLDPLGDKLTIPIPMIVFTAMGFLQWYLIVPMLLLELSGTLMRKPFLDMEPFKKLAPYVRAEGASWAGKAKAVAQYVAIFLGMTIHNNWVQVDPKITFWTLIIVNLIALMSILTRLKLTPKIDQLNEEASSAFKHEE